MSTPDPAVPHLPTPGVYEGVAFSEYLAWPYVNNSSLAPALRSMAHYRHQLDQPDVDKPHLQFGRLVHAGKLEGSIGRHFQVLPPYEDSITKPDGTPYAKPKATKAYRDKVREFTERAEAAGCEVVTAGQFDRLLAMVGQLARHAAQYLEGDGPVELSLVWDDAITGLRCKGRIDKYQPQHARVGDLKTTRDAGDFERAIAKFGYHRQAAFYADGLEANGLEAREHVIVAIESEPPFCVRAAPLDTNAIVLGRREYRAALAGIKRGRASGEWPGYSSPLAWCLPSWAWPQLELHVGDEILTV